MHLIAESHCYVVYQNVSKSVTDWLT